MRDYLDGILSFIGAESLTNEEFGQVTITDQNDHVGVYDALLAIIGSRDDVSDIASRLLYYFQSKGIAVAGAPSAVSNIFVGASIDDDD
jgi:hypothetical protein